MTAGDSGEDNKSQLDMKPSNPAGKHLKMPVDCPLLITSLRSPWS